MTEKKPKDPPRDYEGDLYRKDYAPGITQLLEKLVELDEKTILAELQSERIKAGDFPKRLRVLLTENLRLVVEETFQLGSLSELSLRALRRSATYPKNPVAESKEASAP